MAATNIETVRRVFETFYLRGDPQIQQQAVVELWHEDARLLPLLLAGGALERTVYEGHEEINRFVQEGAFEGWSELKLDVLELRDLGESRVLSHVRWSAVGEGSGAKVVAEAWSVVTLRGGKIVELRAFADEAEALAYNAENPLS